MRGVPSSSGPASIGIPGMRKTYYVYILASQRNGTLYIGVTNDIVRRAFEHREGLVPGFTKKYRIKMLVYSETFEDIGFAIEREKRLKKWNRAWKLELIEKLNPDWHDLYETLNS
jgi:putative endonuclease